MEKMKMRFTNAVASCLVDAPDSAAKTELIEELSDNLFRRFQDMTAAGMDESQAFERALDDLGDVDELLVYLRQFAPQQEDEYVPQLTLHPEQLQAPAEESGEEEAEQEEGEAEREEAQAEQEEAQAGWEEAQAEREEAQADDWDRFESAAEDVMEGVGEAVQNAIQQAEEALRKAKEAARQVKETGYWSSPNGKVNIRFNAGSAPKPPKAPKVPKTPKTPRPPKAPEDWEFSAELDSDEGRFFAGAGPRQERDIIYGFGYDKDKGGFFTQWGEYKASAPDGDSEAHGPYFATEISGLMYHNEDGTYSVTDLKNLRGLDVQTVSGDITIHVGGDGDSGVVIDGDVDDLEVTCTADGVLRIQEGRTASSSFFSRMGFGCADVVLTIPAQRWDMFRLQTTSGDVSFDGESLEIERLNVTTANGAVYLDVDSLDAELLQISTASGDFDSNAALTARKININTASGDVTLNDRVEVDSLNVGTVSGDLNCVLARCEQLNFKTASGDFEGEGECGTLCAKSMSGSVAFEGNMEQGSLESASGDLEINGWVRQLRGKSTSGDIRLESSTLPERMELSTKSGDCEVRVPMDGAFTVWCRTVSGDVHSDLPLARSSGGYLGVCGEGGDPTYKLSSVSGDVTIERY